MQYVTDYNYQIPIIATLFFAAWCVYWVVPKFGFFPGALFCYMGLNSIWIWLFKHNRYEFLCVSDVRKPGCLLNENGLPMLDAYTQQALHFHAADSFLKAMIFLVPLMIFATTNAEKYKWYGVMIAWFAVAINSGLIIVRYILGYCAGENTCGGFIGNPSLSASVMVCALPFFLGTRKIFIFPIVAVAVVLSESSIALGLLCVFIFSFLFRSQSRLTRSLSLAALVCVPIIGYIMLGDRLLFTSGRLGIWKLMLGSWLNNSGNYTFGTGWGTYRVFSINLEDHAEFAIGSVHRWWSWLHNDWIENFLFETGVVGFVLAAITYTVAVLKSALKERHMEPAQPDVTLSLVLYGIFMALNPALHYPVPMVFGAWLFVLALRRNPLQYSNLTA